MSSAHWQLSRQSWEMILFVFRQDDDAEGEKLPAGRFFRHENSLRKGVTGRLKNKRNARPGRLTRGGADQSLPAAGRRKQGGGRRPAPCIPWVSMQNTSWQPYLLFSKGATVFAISLRSGSSLTSICSAAWSPWCGIPEGFPQSRWRRRWFPSFRPSGCGLSR